MKTLTQEELKQFIKDNNLDIKQLAAIAATVAAEPEVAKSTSESDNSKTIVTTKTPSKPGFEMSVCTYPDFAITRVTPKTTKTLSFMVSQKSYCIITNSFDGKKTEVEKLTAESYADFTSNMPEFPMPEDFWIDKITKGKKCYDQIMEYLDLHVGTNPRTTIYDMIKDHCAPKLSILVNPSSWANNGNQDKLKAYSKFPILYKEYWKNYQLLHYMIKHSNSVKYMVDKFGLNNTRDLFDSIQISLVDISTIGYEYNFCNETEIDQSDYYHSCIPTNIEFQYAALKEYILYKAVEFGYAKSYKDFFTTWRDTLNLQKKIYGKIKDKYPDSLPTVHQQLIYKYNMHKMEIDAKLFQEQSEIAQKYSWKMDKDEGRFIFIAPETPNDFYDEATQQANCLASYVEKFTKGDDIIMFMRDKLTPETSEVTIEICDGAITQAYRAHNLCVTSEQHEALLKWAKKFNLRYN